MLAIYRSALGLAVLMAGLAQAPGAAAHNHHADHEQARQALTAGEVLPLRTVLGRISPEYPGRVINVEFERDHGVWVYKIKVLQKGGQLVKLEVDARSGSIIDAQRRRMRHKRKN